MEAPADNFVETLARLSLFADLPHPQVEALAHTFTEEVFAAGQRVIRQDMAGSGFYVILDGEAAVVIDGEERARITRGDFFGEVSVLLGEPPVADVVALRAVRCLHLGMAEVEPFLLSNPSVMLRMLQAQARRLRNANRWRS